ncbi:MAG: hypothetical protein ACM3VZ_14130 [Acidobacteriota bacterium]
MNRIPSWPSLCAACLWALASVAHAGSPAALLTMLEGSAWVIHGAARSSTPEGARLEADDFFETAPTTTLARLEFEDGTVVDLGPSSRVWVSPVWPHASPADPAGAAVAYLLQGWAKVSSEQAPLRGRAWLATPALDVIQMARGAVVRVQGQDAEVFAESGDAAVRPRGKRASTTPLKLGRGQFLSQHGEAAAQVLPRPSADFLAAVPRPFMDTLPARRDAFKGKRVSLTPGAPLSYADLQAWLNAEPRVRARLPQRWHALAQDPAFRRQLAAQLSLHPEWASVLSPPPSSHTSAQP